MATNKYLFQGSLLFPKSVPKLALADDVLAGILTDTQVEAKIQALKTELMGGNVAAAFDTFKELAEAAQADQSAITNLLQLVNGKATPADIQSAVAAVIGTATNAGNTLGKLEALQGSISGASNAYPTEVQAAMTSAEKIFVYIGQQLTALKSSGGNQTTAQSDLNSRLTVVEQSVPNKASQADVNALTTRVGNAESNVASKAAQSELNATNQRVTALENRPANTTTTGATGTVKSVRVNSATPPVTPDANGEVNLNATLDRPKLCFAWRPGFDTNYTAAVSADMVGAYQSSDVVNLANVQYQKNGANVSFPFTLAAGDTLYVVGTPGDAAKSSAVNIKQF